MKIEVFGTREHWPREVIVPNQVHRTKIVEVVNGNEFLSGVDGVWTRNFNLKLGIKTADCAPITFWTDEKFGIIHAGWRGLLGGICEEMLSIFSDPGREAPQSRDLQIQVGPMLPVFEIQRDECFEQIREKFGEAFFEYEEEKILFHFQKAIQSMLPNAQFDPRITFDDPNLASWRRDQDNLRNLNVISSV